MLNQQYKFSYTLFVVSLILCGCTATMPDDVSSNTPLQNNLEQAIEPGSDAFYLNIARELYVTKQYKQVYQITSGLAEKNNVKAQYLLGYLYYYGQGVPVDLKQGSKWISIAADSGYRPAIEALVLIKHGLTPDNKCSSADLLAKNIIGDEKSAENRASNKTNKVHAVLSNELEEGDILITPKNNKSTEDGKNRDFIRSDKMWDRFTIQLIKTENKQNTLNYASEFRKRNPELQV